MLVIGIDPGASGALAFYFPDTPERISVYDMPLVDGEINCGHLAYQIKSYKPDFAIIELVGARPGQGVSSMFKFGVAFGMARATVSTLMIPHRFVTPAKWKKHFNLPADKEKARELATQLWPSAMSFARKKDHGRAEAALLCKYAAEAINI